MAEFSFNLSDDVGPMKIILEGFTDAGEYIYVEKLFEVLLEH